VRTRLLIARERPDTADARALIDELTAELAPLYPAESSYGLSVDDLLLHDVRFFVMRLAAAPIGCGGYQLCGGYAELKRMYLRPLYRGRGFNQLLIQRLADEARSEGVRLLRLETGVLQAAAIHSYQQAGFVRRPPFGAYPDDPQCLFFERSL
jgi:putative acetyltransferase